MAENIKQAVEAVTESVKQLAVGEKPKQQVKKEKKPKPSAAASGPDELSPPPAYINSRLELFDKLKAEYDAETSLKSREDITVTLPDGKQIFGKSWETTPGSIARDISKSLYEKVFIAKVDGEVWDLERPLEKSCKLQLLDFEDDDAKLGKLAAGNLVFISDIFSVLAFCSSCAGRMFRTTLGLRSVHWTTISRRRLLL